MTELTTDAGLAQAVLETVGTFRRRTRAQIGSPFGEALTRAELELLRHVRRHPGCTVGECAAALGIAANTASTLVTRLTGAGHLIRTRDASDGRVFRLELTDSAHTALIGWRDARARATTAAVADLSDADRAALAAALPVLDRLGQLIAKERA